MSFDLSTLRASLVGELLSDESIRLIYATDASAYRELPLAVAMPANVQDLHQIIRFARENKLGIIPRAAGTSIAGQVVGNGIVVDISRHFSEILELNREEAWVRVQPGVILDELNRMLAIEGLFFGPETSTSNRCMIGGMVGNNSCGAHSLIYGSTREHVLSLKAILSDGSEVEFKRLGSDEYAQKLKSPGLEGDIYRATHQILANPENQKEILEQFPHPDIERRNTGYALDMLLRMKPFSPDGHDFNMCSLIAGSEGTLAFMTEITLNLVPLPPTHKALLCVHLKTIQEALQANLVALANQPVAVELMDKAILDLTKGNIEQNKNRFFIEGDPGALLLVEFAEQDADVLLQKVQQSIVSLQESGYGFAFPVLRGSEIKQVWELRKAGLGVLTNMPGDAKPVPLIEDTAVRPVDLPEYIREFDEILAKYGKSCVYYAHIATGELHLRPVLNLKLKEEVDLF
ncbi:MAG: FAD-binding oxidoreductase, partial [Bacteroidales bacterium]|nr:FAD-binding oxidoreductase [Bacteroidales bacterium]